MSIDPPKDEARMDDGGKLGSPLTPAHLRLIDTLAEEAVRRYLAEERASREQGEGTSNA